MQRQTHTNTDEKCKCKGPREKGWSGEMYLSRLLCPLQDRHQPGLRTAVSVGASSGSNTNCVSANTSPLAVSRGAAALDLRYTAKPLAPHAEPSLSPSALAKFSMRAPGSATTKTSRSLSASPGSLAVDSQRQGIYSLWSGPRHHGSTESLHPCSG